MAKPGKYNTHTCLSWLCGILTFGELEPLAGALLPVFFPLVLTRVTGQKPELLQPRAQFRIELHQSSGNSQTGCTRLSGYTAAVGQNQQVELIHGLGGR